MPSPQCVTPTGSVWHSASSPSARTQHGMPGALRAVPGIQCPCPHSRRCRSLTPGGAGAGRCRCGPGTGGGRWRGPGCPSLPPRLPAPPAPWAAAAASSSSPSSSSRQVSSRRRSGTGGRGTPRGPRGVGLGAMEKEVTPRSPGTARLPPEGLRRANPRRGCRSHSPVRGSPSMTPVGSGKRCFTLLFLPPWPSEESPAESPTASKEDNSVGPLESPPGHPLPGLDSPPARHPPSLRGRCFQGAFMALPGLERRLLSPQPLELPPPFPCSRDLPPAAPASPSHRNTRDVPSSPRTETGRGHASVRG